MAPVQNRSYNNFWRLFTSWLQPGKQTKEQMVSQFVIEQFCKTYQCKDKLAMKEKWESSGRNLVKFKENLRDECLKPPKLVSRWSESRLSQE